MGINEQGLSNTPNKNSETEGEKIVAAAIYYYGHKGNICVAGPTHGIISRHKNNPTNGDGSFIEKHGFVTDTNRFVKPEDALNIAEKAFQIKLQTPPATILDTSMIEGLDDNVTLVRELTNAILQIEGGKIRVLDRK